MVRGGEVRIGQILNKFVNAFMHKIPSFFKSDNLLFTVNLTCWRIVKYIPKYLQPKLMFTNKLSRIDIDQKKFART
jgi:hypothetical protein